MVRFSVGKRNKGATDRSISPVDEATVDAAMTTIAEPLEAELRRILSQALLDVPVVRVLFEVRGEDAFDGFPVTVRVGDERWHELGHPADGRPVLSGLRFLDPRRAYPIGRFDMAGMDFTEDLALVERVIVERFVEVWSRLDVDRRITAYIGRIRDDGDYDPIPSPVLNLTTKETETIFPFTED